MTRLKHLLLAGTMVPALALTPFAGAFAQTPQQQLQERLQKAAPEAPKNAAPPPVAPKAPVAPRPAAEAPHAPAAQPPHQAQTHEAPTRAAPPAAREAQPHAPAPAAQRPPAAEPVTPRRVEKAPAPVTPQAPTRAVDPSRANPQTNAPRPAAEPNHAPAPARTNEAKPAAPAAQPTPPAANNARPAEPNRAPANATRQERPNQAQPNQPAPNRAGQAQPAPNQMSPNNNGAPPNQRREGGIGPGGALAIGAAAGFAGGFLAATGAQHLDEVRRDRRETVEDGRTYIREPGRTIVQDGDRSYIVHDENDRFRQLGYDVRREQQGRDFVDIINRPDGTQILTYTTPDGRMLRRVRRGRDGREYVLIDNSYEGGVRSYQQDIVDLPPPPMRIPRDRYIVDYAAADEGLIYDTFAAPPLEPPPARYTLDQIRYSPGVRRYVRSVDINTINFDTGSWIVPGAATGKLQALAGAIQRTIAKKPNSVFLVEGFTDATGNPTDNLSLSDRRAQSVAAILTKDFNVPPENLTTQGYGQQNLKENTQGPSAINRRVVVQNITPLLAAGGPPPR